VKYTGNYRAILGEFQFTDWVRQLKKAPKSNESSNPKTELNDMPELLDGLESFLSITSKEKLENVNAYWMWHYLRPVLYRVFQNSSLRFSNW